jgi:hypothetical protein
VKRVRIILLSCLVFVTLFGCAQAYQSVSVDNPSRQLTGYEGQRISIAGIPNAPQRRDFLPPTPLREGRWGLVVNGVRCTETINFENEPRIRSMLQIALSAQKENRPIRVSGRIKNGQLEMEYFDGMRTDTAWYKNKNPYYSYGEYYEWYPFAYSPNSRVLKTLGTR